MQTTEMSFLTPDFQQALMAAGNESLMFFIQGVKVGMSVKAAENAKWQRLGVILALTFGTLTFMKHFGGGDV